MARPLPIQVDYDNGKSFKNSAIVWNAVKQAFTRASPATRKIVRLLKRYRPAYCLSFWEPGVAMMLNVLNCPTKLIQVASQGQIYNDDSGVERGGFLMRALHQINVGKKGLLVPLSVLPMDGAIPQIVRLPALPSPTPLGAGGEEPFFVAYTTVPQARAASKTSHPPTPIVYSAPAIGSIVPNPPGAPPPPPPPSPPPPPTPHQVLSPIKKGLVGHRVLLFVKEKRLKFYTRKYQKYSHVEVRLVCTQSPFRPPHPTASPHRLTPPPRDPPFHLTGSSDLAPVCRLPWTKPRSDCVSIERSRHPSGRGRQARVPLLPERTH